MAMKISSINFVKETDVPVRIVNTDMGAAVTQLHETLRKQAIPAGQAVAFTMSGAKRYTRYQLQGRLQKLGHKIQVSGKWEDGKFFITNASGKSK